ncbi:MAG: RHS repeat protein, partial [Actinomycetia bacterium]|nr:RHS repeat protein [Actinomycetes bacterium]
MNRKKQVIYPATEKGAAPAVKRIVYDDYLNTVITTDPEGRTVVQTMDWAGNITEVLSQGDYNTPINEQQLYSYEYDELGRKTLFTDPKGIQTFYYYNERDLLVEQKFTADTAQAETKSDFMEYDSMSRLLVKTDRKGQLAAFSYDSLGRNTEVIHYLNGEDYNSNNPSGRVTTAYDKRGNAVRIDNRNLIEYYKYDYANRVTELNRKLKDNLADIRASVADVWGGPADGQTFNFSYGYNDAGMVTDMTYPDGSEHTFEYDDYLARLTGISEQTEGEPSPAGFVTDLSYTNSGVVTDMTYANGVTQHWDFDNRKRISHINISDGTGETIEDLIYKLNKSGDILCINENEYEYDGFDRITAAKTLLPGSENDPSKLIAKSFGTSINSGPILVNGEIREYNVEVDLNSDGRINGIDQIAASFIEEGDLYDIESFTYDKNG